MSHARLCYTQDVREKEFINKVHKHLPKEIYRWKINDPYHGGVPDTYYAGSTGFCFIEYKYQDTLPRRDTSKIQINNIKNKMFLFIITYFLKYH